MQLQPGERSILAYFTSQEAASNAADQLKAMGYNDTQLNKISNYNRTGAGALPHSISALTSAGDNPEHYRSYGPLLASSPVVSGLAANDFSYYTHIVTVVSDAAQINQALDVLRNYGGRA